MEPPAILLDVAGPLARITLNRPDRLNAMDLAWIEGLLDAVERVRADPTVRLVVIQGAGRAFCAGLDLDMMAREGMPPDFYAGQERAFHALELMDKLVVAAIHGYCLGGGVQLAIACDLRVCSSDARLGLPAVNEGLFPGMAPFRLPRLVGLGPARRLILSGELIGSAEALQLGLVDYVVPAERFAAGVAEISERLLRAPWSALIGAKRLLRRAFEASFDEVYRESVPLLAACLASPEVAAAREAWRQRRGD